MTGPREELADRARQWMEYAEADLRGARHLMTMPDCPNWMVAYHAEQAAEKALKAFLVHKEVDFPPTHNITMLREFCSQFGDWALELEAADELTRFAAAARYPSLGLDLSSREIERIVKIAESVCNRVREVMSDLDVSQ